MDAHEGPSMLFDEEEADRRGRARRIAEEKLKRTIFGDDDGSYLEDSEEEQLDMDKDALLDEEDEMADFIVDEDETDEHGRPSRRGLRLRRTNPCRHREFPHPQSRALMTCLVYKRWDHEFHEADEENHPSSDQKPILRWHKVLWTILELDGKWLLFQKRKSALQLYYNQRFEEEQSIYDETRLHLDLKFFESITKSLKVADTEREIDDVDSKFNLHFPPGEVVVDKGEFKRPTRKSQYGICSEAELRKVTSHGHFTIKEIPSSFLKYVFLFPNVLVTWHHHLENIGNCRWWLIKRSKHELLFD